MSTAVCILVESDARDTLFTGRPRHIAHKPGSIHLSQIWRRQTNPIALVVGVRTILNSSGSGGHHLLRCEERGLGDASHPDRIALILLHTQIRERDLATSFQH